MLVTIAILERKAFGNVSAGVEGVLTSAGTGGPYAAIFSRHILSPALPHQVILVDAPIMIAKVGCLQIVGGRLDVVVHERDLSWGPFSGGRTLVIVESLLLSLAQSEALGVTLRIDW